MVVLFFESGKALLWLREVRLPRTNSQSNVPPSNKDSPGSTGCTALKYANFFQFWLIWASFAHFLSSEMKQSKFQFPFFMDPTVD